MELKKCTCGCTIFETIRTYQYDDSDFYIDSRSKELRVATNGIPVAKCIQCGTINVPSTSMAGVSLLDPRVGAYRELLRAVEVRNKSIETNSKVDVILDGVCGKIYNLENKECSCNIKEEPDGIETGKRGRKKSETSIP